MGVHCTYIYVNHKTIWRTAGMDATDQKICTSYNCKASNRPIGINISFQSVFVM